MDMWQHETIGLPDKKCSFVSATVKQSRGNRELQRQSTTAAFSLSRTEDGKQSESPTVTLLNKTEAGRSERDGMYEAFSQASVVLSSDVLKK